MILKFTSRWISAALLSICLVTAYAAEDDLVTLNFVNSDIESTIKAVGIITGQNFLIDPKVKGSINIISNQPVPRSMVYPILLSALRQQGFTAVENDSIVKIMPDNDAKTQAMQVFTRKSQAAGDRVVTKVFPLKHASATQIVTALRPLVPANNLLAAHPSSNTVVITDYADNVFRIGQIIDNIDQPTANEIFTIRVRHASALDVAQTIGRLMPEVFMQGVASPMPLGEGVKRTVVVPDVRNNQILVRSESTAHARQIRSLVESLDIPAASGSNINVVYLRNAEAVALADTLKGILTGSGESTSSSSNTDGTSSGFSSSLANSTTSPSSSTTGTGMASDTGGSLTTGSSTTTSTGSTAQSSGASVQVAGATVLIRADRVTNSLVITAPDHIYNNLRAVIDKLDARRAQIYIEALIAEVNITKAEDIGVQWFAARWHDSNGNIAMSNPNPSASSLLGGLYSLIADGSVEGLAIPNTFSLGFFKGDPTEDDSTLGILANALERTGDGNILSTPNLLMLDNEEASIMVGQNIPILTGSYTTTANSSTNPFQTVERRDIGIMLKIRPQISDSGSITLRVLQEVSSIDNTVDTLGAGLATKVRQIDTKVLIDDGQTIVLGGLIDEKVTKSQFKVPLLGDVPYLGQLFRYDMQDHSKTNLMVFLRPVILRDAKSAQTLSSERYEYLRMEQERFSASRNMPAVQLPSLEKQSATEPTSAMDNTEYVLDMRQKKTLENDPVVEAPRSQTSTNPSFEIIN